jgi:hypothetical protein
VNVRDPEFCRRTFGLLALSAAAGATAVACDEPPPKSAPPTAQTPAPTARTRESLFPKGVRPTRLHAIPESSLSRVERVLVATLQGQVARRPANGPPEGIYVDAGSGYQVWLADLAARHDVEVVAADSAWAIVDRFRAGPTGVSRYVVYRERDGSVNAATSIAAISGAVAVAESLEDEAIQHGLKRAADVRGRSDAWVKSSYWSRFRHDLVFEQKPQFPNQLRDYATMAGAYMFYDGNTDLRREVVDAMARGSATIGWGDSEHGEKTFVSMSSKVGVGTLAADHARNLAPLSGITADTLSQRASGKAPAPRPNTHHVSFVVTDGDNIQWLLGEFQGNKSWYASPLRGSFDMGWGMAPALIDMAPSVMQWYYDNESSGAHQDRFTVGPSGGAYLYPSMYPAADLDLHTARLEASMARADLGVVQILDVDSFDRTDLWSSYLRRQHINGLIYLEYSPYDGLKGRIGWANGKPVISAGAMLWAGEDGADDASVAARLNAAPRDPRTAEGYTVVMVHAWSKSLSNVKNVIDNLHPNVKVVTPDALVELVRRNVRH